MQVNALLNDILFYAYMKLLFVTFYIDHVLVCHMETTTSIIHALHGRTGVQLTQSSNQLEIC